MLTKKISFDKESGSISADFKRDSSNKNIFTVHKKRLFTNNEQVFFMNNTLKSII